MILAGLILLGVGGADLVRAFVPRRWLGYLVVGLVILAIGVSAAALLEAIVAVVVAAGWVWAVPTHRPVRAAFWPALALGVLCALAVMSIPPRASAGVIAEVWAFPTPGGELSFDAAVLAVGAVVFLFESANVVVRLALNSVGSGATSPSEAASAPDAETVDDDALAEEVAVEGTAPAAPQPLAHEPSLKGGRLIGPLERVLVFSLTLLGAYTLVAAFIAAKGIVRFPEISRDSDRGNSAEYFLIGSMVSWVTALSAAALVWWSLSIA
ncbi:hypothetical protein [Microbacterium thalassium]|uniref:Uncharacterized protein n=1 Tax=Microbacterium thalassium TaxID=362649 RepID=A0A7X0FQ16_9MICO|nr:hypothetical protein [Microbacterium thalassium]MBB6391568.1 hypothetical protein [Microbacterium thalassium]